MFTFEYSTICLFPTKANAWLTCLFTLHIAYLTWKKFFQFKIFPFFPHLLFVRSSQPGMKTKQFLNSIYLLFSLLCVVHWLFYSVCAPFDDKRATSVPTERKKKIDRATAEDMLSDVSFCFSFCCCTCINWKKILCYFVGGFFSFSLWLFPVYIALSFLFQFKFFRFLFSRFVSIRYSLSHTSIVRQNDKNEMNKNNVSLQPRDLGICLCVHWLAACCYSNTIIR